LEDRLVPSTYTVTTLSDAPSHTGLSLRDAVDAANGDPGSRVQFAALAVGGTVALQQGALRIEAPMTIDGTTATGQGVTVSGLNRDRVFDVRTAGEVDFNNLTIANGRAPTADTAGSGNGGGIYAAGPGATVVLTHCTVAGNFATGDGSGGGIYVNGSVMLLGGTTVRDNSAPNHGGGAYAAGSFAATNSALTGNRARDGGGLYEAGAGATVVLGNSTVVHNLASGGNGGGIWAPSDVSVRGVGVASVSYNTAFGKGGGIYADAGNVTLNGALVEGNNATQDGGGVWADLNVSLNGFSEAGLNLALGRGGGVFSDDGVVRLNSGYVVGNTAGDGGGVWSGADVVVAIGTVAGNTANGNGGGIYANGSVSLNGIIVEDNIAIQTYPLNGNGGGIWATGDVAVTSGFVGRNNADHDGGGIYSLDSHVSLATGATVEGNFAGNDGGGTWGRLAGNGTSNLDGSVRDNTANHNGGGAFLTYTFGAGGDLRLSNSTLQNNFALNEGGGAYVDGVAAVTVDHSRILSNTAGLNGGGLSSHNVANLSITYSTLASNTSLAGSGGGLAVDGIFTLVGFLSHVALDDDTFGALPGTTQSAGVSGGGAFVSRSQMSVNHVTFNDNVSYGGPTSGSALEAALGAQVSLKNTLVVDTNGASSVLGVDLVDSLNASIVSLGHNLVGDASWANIAGFARDLGDIPDGAQGLTPLALHGGTTETYNLLPGGDAVGNGDNSGPFVDQNGWPRPATGSSIGSVEL
jgi:predicted outer membrane repeat protein